jgi:LPS-assembly protein
MTFRWLALFISITGLAVRHPQGWAQQLTSLAPPPALGAAGPPRRIGTVLPNVGEPLPDAPDAVRYPDAVPVAVPERGTPVTLESDTQSRQGSLYTLDGRVVVTYENRTLEADHMEYDGDTGDVTVTGHVVASGGTNDEHIRASHGTLNIKTQTGRFYDVSGSVGVKQSAERLVYANGNPFLFTGRMVVKTGPQDYDVYDGTVTSCQLLKPDWVLSAAKFSMDGEKARATNSVFRLLNVPLLYLPYVTYPVDAADRQSGFLIPVLGDSSSKGLTFGEQVYWAINRSTDALAGAVYYSARGWGENGTIRYRGRGEDFARAHFTALQDRGYTPSGGIYTNQGGEDVTVAGRRDFPTGEAGGSQTRLVANVEYLSSFVYREAFTDSFNEAVSSDVVSQVYAVHEWDGMAASLEGDRYQGEKRVATTLLPEQQVHIFHAPSLEFTTTDHGLGTTGLVWDVDSSVTALKRVQPNFATSGMIERLDLRPEVAYPFTVGGWRMRPAVALRETYYSRSRFDPSTLPPGPAQGVPVESPAGLSRTDVEVQVDLRAPVLERTFESGLFRRAMRHDVKHTIEPALTYRFVSGIGNFLDVLRFDPVDVVSDTNEFEYGVTQRLFLRETGVHTCRTAESGADGIAEADGEMEDGVGDLHPVEAALPVCGNREWISWRLTQKYFFDPVFGGAIAPGRRNIFETTLAFSGIAFLTEPRNISPLLSRLRVRTSEKTDVEWDVDYDTGAKKFTANNIFLDGHAGNVFAGLSYARLNAPGRSYVEGVASAVSDFSQMRALLGYGKPTKPGLSVAANVGLDLNLATVQYGALETSYNWNCCGLSVEYRKYELGTARNENAYKFNFTLANIGTAGNIRRAERLF